MKEKEQLDAARKQVEDLPLFTAHRLGDFVPVRGDFVCVPMSDRVAKAQAAYVDAIERYGEGHPNTESARMTLAGSRHGPTCDVPNCPCVAYGAGVYRQ